MPTFIGPSLPVIQVRIPELSEVEVRPRVIAPPVAPRGPSIGELLHVMQEQLTAPVPSEASGSSPAPEGVRMSMWESLYED